MLRRIFRNRDGGGVGSSLSGAILPGCVSLVRSAPGGHGPRAAGGCDRSDGRAASRALGWRSESVRADRRNQRERQLVRGRPAPTTRTALPTASGLSIRSSSAHPPPSSRPHVRLRPSALVAGSLPERLRPVLDNRLERLAAGRTEFRRPGRRGGARRRHDLGRREAQGAVRGLRIAATGVGRLWIRWPVGARAARTTKTGGSSAAPSDDDGAGDSGGGESPPGPADPPAAPGGGWRRRRSGRALVLAPVGRVRNVGWWLRRLGDRWRLPSPVDGGGAGANDDAGSTDADTDDDGTGSGDARGNSGGTPGRDDDTPGNSGNAPGHGDDEEDDQQGDEGDDDTPGNSGNAPGHNDGEDDSNDDGPGNSGNAPGHNKDEEENEEGGPGNSENAPGQNKDGGSPGGDDDSPGNSAWAPGHNKGNRAGMSGHAAGSGEGRRQPRAAPAAPRLPGGAVLGAHPWHRRGDAPHLHPPLRAKSCRGDGDAARERRRAGRRGPAASFPISPDRLLGRAPAGSWIASSQRACSTTGRPHPRSRLPTDDSSIRRKGPLARGRLPSRGSVSARLSGVRSPASSSRRR